MKKFRNQLRKLSEKQRALWFLAAFFVVFGIYRFFHVPPEKFPLGDVITVRQGQSLQIIAESLRESNIIKSPFVFRAAVILLGGEKRVMAGDYLLDNAEGPIALAYRLVHGRYHLDVSKITILEGWNIYQIGDYLEKNLINFNKKRFISLAKDKEGYLFPDTYFVSPAISPEEIITRMSVTFDRKIESVPAIAAAKYSLHDILTMASIVELEARTMESRKVIAGILWKRLSMGMPLQVDSTFQYINGKNTYELTYDDLKIDSPYNTYVYKGLPPGPVANPGLDAIAATLAPSKSSYLYFLSSRDGTMHYAATFDQHKKNKELYLN